MSLSTPYKLLLLIIVTLGVYYPTIFAPLNSLDDQVFVTHLLNQDGFSWLRHFVPGGTHNYFRPLLSLSFEIDKYVGGFQEPFMHLFNVLIHLVNVLLVWALACRFSKLIGTSRRWLPFIAALLFAVHPINSEAVNWILGRTDLLAGSFVLFSLYALFVFYEGSDVLWGLASALALLAGALCKETALFMLPTALFLAACMPKSKNKSWRFVFVMTSLYMGSVAIYFFLRWGAFHLDRGLGHTAKLASQMIGAQAADVASQTTVPFPWLEAINVVLKVGGFYALKLIQPLPLNFAINHVSQYYLAPGIVLIIILLVCAYRRGPVGWFFLASASIAISALLVLFTKLAWTPVAERYMYIPAAPFVIGSVYAVGNSIKDSFLQRFVGVLGVSLIVVWGWQTSSRNIVWQDNLTLYQDAVRQSPDFAPAKNQLALALQKHGYEEEAAKILVSNKMPSTGNAAMNAAVAVAEDGNYAAARSELLSRLADADDYQTVKTLELLLRLTNKYVKNADDELKDAAYRDIAEWLERIKEISPTGFNYYRIGRAQLRLGDKAAAQVAFAEAVKRLPADSIYKKPAEKLARDLGR